MEDAMSKQCAFCGKKPQTGNYVSHSNIKTKRVFNPNLQNVRHQFANGEVRTVSVHPLPALRAGHQARRPQGRLVFGTVCAVRLVESPRLSAAGDFFAFLPKGLTSRP